MTAAEASSWHLVVTTGAGVCGGSEGLASRYWEEGIKRENKENGMGREDVGSGREEGRNEG